MAIPVQEGVSFPVAPTGFDPVKLWAYPDLFRLAANPPEVITLDFLSPIQITVDQIVAVADALRGAAGSIGGDLVAYGLWQGPTMDIDVPTTLCLPGTNQCIDIPSCINIPLLGCVPIGGAHLASAYKYRLWLAFGSGAVASWNYRPAVFVVLIAVLGALLGVLLIIGFIYVEQGKMTPTDFAKMVKDYLRVPGDNIGAATGQIPWTFVGIGIAMIATAGLMNLNVQPSVHYKTPGGGFGVDVTGSASSPRRP
jgi:hypothetical protein